ncbi:helix-turn-helix domain-containing protein [Parasutterella excrementihominis]|uniref:helix-turn-helix domain-containing protein n=1 Tax=Parasutterella excrementihominis TaxID=487175 RepID=UPI003AF8E695
MKEYPSFVELRLLQELFKESNLTAAAAKLSLTTPTASHYLTHLRNIFDDRLFIKAKNGLVPTSRAEEVVECLRLRPLFPKKPFVFLKFHARYVLVV